MLLRVLHTDGKNRYGEYACVYCEKVYVTRIRHRVANNCGCRPNRQTHGHEKGRKVSPELKCYRKMRERCLSTACKDYGNYGGRGIVICDRWLEAFDNFLSDMGPRPSAKHSIERLDVDGPYAPDNCVWATKSAQANNTRASAFVTIDGRKQTVSQWLRELGVARTTYYRRLGKGLSPQEALCGNK